MSISDQDVSTPSHLRDKYAIVGIGETTYSKSSGMTTRAMATWAIRNAMDDAGLKASDIDGILAYQDSGDSTFSQIVAADLGIRPNFYVDTHGGGSSTEMLIGLAIGAIEAGMCKTAVIFRSLNGYSQARMGLSGRTGAAVTGDLLHKRPYGWEAAGQMFSLAFMRHMHDHGTRPEQVAMVKVIHSEHASNNPKAIYKQRVTVDDVLNSRWIVKPLHLLDCCVETDNATAIIVTRADRARDCRHVPVLIRTAIGRYTKPRVDMYYQHGPVSSGAAEYGAKLLWPNADVKPEDIDVTGAYDAFTFTAMLQLEGYGFCKVGEGGQYVSDGTIRLGGRRPNNTSGGQLCEGYTHGISLVVENVRQLRHDADDSCPMGPDGRRIHTHDHREGGCRQVRDAELSANLGWANPGAGSALVLRRG